MARYTAFLDACELVPTALADSLLRLADRELYRPIWSGRVLEEVVWAVCALHPGLPEQQIRRRVADTDFAFPDASVNGWELLVDSVDLPDPGDRHVLAAA